MFFVHEPHAPPSRPTAHVWGCTDALTAMAVAASMVMGGFAGQESKLEYTCGAADATELLSTLTRAAPGHADSDANLPVP